MIGRLLLLLAPIAFAALGFASAGRSWSAEAMTFDTRVLDDFATLDPWRAIASDGVTSAIRPAAADGKALQLDFDFAGVAGYASAQRALPLDLPDNFEISFRIRGDAPVNTLELKLIDGSGENVWWHRRQDFAFPTDWTRVRIKRRQIEFAWGPTKDQTLRHTEKIELAITAGKGGGKGAVLIDQIAIRELPRPPPVYATPVAKATSSLPGGEPGLVFDGKDNTGWRSDPAQAPEQGLAIDFGAPREFGGLVLRWDKKAFASRYDVSLSDDGLDWQVVRRVTEGNGGNDPLMLPESEARFVKIAMHGGPGPGYALNTLEIRDLGFGASPNAFMEAIARDSLRGRYPRGLIGEQTYWTVVGVDGGSESGLIGEDGAIEVRRGGYSIEPFILSNSELTTWADAQIEHSLLDGYLPAPSVTWRHPRFELQVTAFATGMREDAQLVMRYNVTNTTDRPQSLKLALAIRPFQVNPPVQMLNIRGGVSPIWSLKWDSDTFRVNGGSGVSPLSAPDSVGASSFDSGSYPDKLLSADAIAGQAAEDETGLASGVLVYDLKLGARETATVGLVSPLSADARPPQLAVKPPKAWLDEKLQEVAANWRGKLNQITFDVPPEGRRVVDSLRSALAQILMSRDGPILKPGTRAYDRSWIRDGAMISESLLRLGHAGLASAYLDWFAPHQFENGKAPCCVDARGPDPTPENDSQGELIFLAAEVYRYTGDRALLARVWPHVEAAAGYMDVLRRSERTDANISPGRRMLYGLMPPSISHEGYSAKPAYSYWDDFWALRGYRDAVFIAETLGEADAAERIRNSRDEFRADLFASIDAATKTHGIDYIPGAADLGDFDATSTTIALSPGGERANLPPDLLNATFERYWTNFTARRDGRLDWTDYTPYELRNVGAFIRLGWRERAAELLDFFFADQRPHAWNQWAEVVGRNVREPRFIGDMPHAWVASDYVRSALEMFAYTRASDQALVLAAGIPQSWLDGAGIAVSDLRSPFGGLSYSLRPEAGQLVLRIEGDAKPPGGFVVALPFETASVTLRQGESAPSWKQGELHVAHAPAEILIQRR